MNHLRLTFLAASLLLCGAVAAQDIHFSQFYASPLTLNPALAGTSDGDYRISGIYRNQWRSVTAPYQTFGASYDMRLLQNKLKKDLFGVGGSLIYDRAGDGNLSLMGVMANAAFHKALDKNSKHFIGIGLQFGFVQRALDYNDIFFPAQYDVASKSFNQMQPNGENFSGSNVNYFDLAAGLLWSSRPLDRLGIFAGGSFFHLTQPKESFLGDSHKLHMRQLMHAGLNIKATERIFITPNILFMNQNKAQQLNFGSAVEYHLKDDQRTVVALGGWFRVDDAPIVSASIEHRGIRLGVAYDINTSDLQLASSNRGAFEISLIYLGKLTRVEAPILVPCPRL